MPLPFLELPSEIRLQIYELLLGGDSICIPDIIHLYLPLAPRVRDSLGLFRTCKQVQREVACVPYGKNIFIFQDGSIEDPEHDGWPRNWEDGLWPLGMYNFLKGIGPLNRLRLRHIVVKIRVLNSCYCRKETFLPPNLPRPRAWGQALAGAFELLARGHELDTLKLMFPHKVAPGLWFRKGKAEVVQSMRQITGIKEFICDDIQPLPGREADPETEEIMQEVKSDMEVGWKPREHG
ncbi:MAG: hypothetical protein M1836_005447 [Candelina mexicana]|nr:MAG: hypothetical protein M1836_005447 [Candelina mexicana]